MSNFVKFFKCLLKILKLSKFSINFLKFAQTFTNFSQTQSLTLFTIQNT